MRSPVLSKPAGSVQLPRLVDTVPDVEVPTALQTTCGVVNDPKVLFGFAYRYVASNKSPVCGTEAERKVRIAPLIV